MASLDGLRMLVVEDEALVAMMVEDMLTDFGCVVVDVAGTLEQGLALAKADEPPIDGAILDVNLGGSKVFPIAEALEARGLKFVFATGYGRAGLESRFADRAVIAKPFGRDALESLMKATWP
jgi:CheY-like chemotaxis protein